MPTDSATPETATLEVVQSSALEATERASIDIQINTAKRFPRSLQAFKKRAIDMALVDEETAESCIYRRPVGMKDGRQQFAEGMSVRMAEIVGASYGNLRVKSFLVEQTDRFVRASGQAIDLETNFASSSEVVESTVDKNGKPYSERQRLLVAKVALSKARRDATFQVVPRALARPVETAVRELLMGNSETLTKRRAKVVAWIGKLGINPKRIYAALGIGGESELGMEQLEVLTGIRTSIRDNEVTLDEAFPDAATTDSKKGLGDVLGKKEEKIPSDLDSQPEPKGEKKSEAKADAAPAPKTYTAQERETILKEVETLMLDHGVGESKVMVHVHAQKLAKEGQDEVGALDTSVLDGLRATISTLATKKK